MSHTELHHFEYTEFVEEVEESVDNLRSLSISGGLNSPWKVNIDKLSGMQSMSDLIELAWAVSPFTIVGEGNVSERNADGFTVKASGADLSTMCDRDVVPCDLYGNQVGVFEESQVLKSASPWFMEHFLR